MCGIVGYISKDAQPIDNFLLAGLRRLEYRGYDSVGMALGTNLIKIKKNKGTIGELLKSEKDLRALKASVAIGHTRWATHGPPSKENAHPHLSYDQNIVLVHNGTIENYLDLLADFKNSNPLVQIDDENDSKILSYFIASELQQNKINLDIFCSILDKYVKGSYAIALFDKRDPDKLFLARNSSPISVGISKNSDYLVASDILAFAGHAESYIDVPDNTCVALSKDQAPVFLSLDKKEIVSYTLKKMVLKAEKISKQGYEDFMLKEIFDQKDVFQTATTLRLKENHIRIDELKQETINRLKNVKVCLFFACGTSYNAALLGASFIEKKCQIRTSVYIASEYNSWHYYDKKECAFFVSQSGETADTLSALRDAKKKGLYTIAICNVLGSTITKQADDTIYTYAGPEISVASTKAFSSQVFTFRILMYFINQTRGEKNQLQALKNEILDIEKYIASIYLFDEKIKNVAKRVYNTNGMLYMGVGDSFSIALEGALKLKEISYIFCFAVPSGEMKHGTIALIDEEVYTIFVEFRKEHYTKLQISIKEILARKGKVVLFANEDFPLDRFNNPDLQCFLIPVESEIKMLLGITVLLQLFAYHIAKARGKNVDKPRNLAKSVTVS